MRVCVRVGGFFLVFPMLLVVRVIGDMAVVVDGAAITAMLWSGVWENFLFVEHFPPFSTIVWQCLFLFGRDGTQYCLCLTAILGA